LAETQSPDNLQGHHCALLENPHEEQNGDFVIMSENREYVAALDVKITVWT
jgi:hypothetical protein